MRTWRRFSHCPNVPIELISEHPYCRLRTHLLMLDGAWLSDCLIETDHCVVVNLESQWRYIGMTPLGTQLPCAPYGTR